MKLRPIKTRPTFNLDCRNETKSRMKAYNPLLDNHLRTFYKGYGIRNLLLKNNLVFYENFRVNLDR